ncbi:MULTISPECIES: hypothetical protein [Sphingosinicellaceae]|uniref:hypothetical protein n=1 Tax=Sphingosinicellaceae TaxID=2820280 RepID=UPI001C1E712A|nr:MULTISPECIES: hypothetical protein [Polymorphobacter]QYE35438.1 hypothetical protein KZX46_05520 [Polymorphobacter sp. PAMC 29334]UAJ11251.1 hypothetical protein KTC28_05995 [Polymorphobacter megasporae]
MISLFRLLPIAALVAVAGCATSNAGIDVKRFHLGAPVTRGTIALVPADTKATFGLETRSYFDAVANALRAQGFTPVPVETGPAYIATLAINQNVAVGPRRPSPFSIGIGGGGFTGGRGGGVGLGGGASFPVGHGSQNAVEIDAMHLTVKRRSDEALIWEGNAEVAIDTRSPQASLSRSVPAMAHALLDGFPGPSGVTQHYPYK